MAALSADTQRNIKGALTYSFKIKNAQQLYVGSFVSLLSGYLQPFAGAAGEQLVGRVLPTPTPTSATTGVQLKGDTSATIVPEATVCMESEVLCQMAVTGATAITDLGKVVYLNSTDNDLTLTRPSRGIPFGIVVRWYSGTTCDVLRFSAEALAQISLAGNGADQKLLAYFAYTDIASGDITIMTPPSRGKITSVSATVVKAFTTAATGSVTIQPKIGTTLTTGGVITVNTSAGTGGTAGDVCAGTSITAANTFSESDALKLTLTLTSTFTAGSMLVFGEFERLIGV